MKWVSREYLGGVDRTACPWLIRKYIDPKAEFIYVPVDDVDEVVKTQGAIPFEVPGVKLNHRDGKLTFEVFIEDYQLDDPILLELAKIVHNHSDAHAPERPGINAIMVGGRYSEQNDFDRADKATYVYDALYSYCKLRLLQDKYKDDLTKMDERQRGKFIEDKMLEEL